MPRDTSFPKPVGLGFSISLWQPLHNPLLMSVRSAFQARQCIKEKKTDKGYCKRPCYNEPFVIRMRLYSIVCLFASGTAHTMRMLFIRYYIKAYL